jgi:hypothetical protein
MSPASGVLADLAAASHVDPLSGSHSYKEQNHKTKENPAGSKEPNASDYWVLNTAADLYTDDGDAPEWVVGEMLARGGTSVMIAKPKVGKSTTQRELVRCVLRGEPFLGRPTVQGNVIVLALEGRKRALKDSFKALGIAETEGLYWHTGKAPDDALATLAATIDHYQAVLVIVDTLFKLVRPKKGDDYAEMVPHMEKLEEIARLTGAHIQGSHHARKGEADAEDIGDASLGSTAIFGGVDTLLLITKIGGGARCIQTEQREGRPLPRSELSFDQITGRVSMGESMEERKLREVREAIADCLLNGEKTEKEIREVVKGSPVPGVLRLLVDKGDVRKLGKGGKTDPFRYALANAELDEPLELLEPAEPEEPQPERGVA